MILPHNAARVKGKSEIRVSKIRGFTAAGIGNITDSTAKPPPYSERSGIIMQTFAAQ